MKLFNKFVLVTVLFISTFGNKDRCGEDYGKCDGDDCCSQYNWCGTSQEHCGTGCQSLYGTCGSKEESDDFEPKEGKIEWVGFRFSEGGVKSNYGKITRWRQLG